MPGSVAHYNLLEHIGEGVFGDVYRARDTKVGRTVALKLQREPLPEGRRHERLVDDARAAAKISHPNIATLFDVGHFRRSCQPRKPIAPATDRLVSRTATTRDRPSGRARVPADARRRRR